MSKFQKYGLLALALSPLSAFAAAPDVTAATSALTDAGTSIGTVGAAMIGAAAAGIVYRWVTAFLVK